MLLFLLGFGSGVLASAGVLWLIWYATSDLCDVCNKLGARQMDLHGRCFHKKCERFLPVPLSERRTHVGEHN